ncbi:hypothetical protein Dgeo_2953 (plasmid) [Deinococcus geothermalis DSM 11300]|uniref:Uncharacterized protein n=1 Tax=Deinococcus geothermalis (strain DSM 11300 / CIP 105573 / AG-3a) TaxID=319795 RepID=A8ZR87_DEIGD|nr:MULTISPECIES: hypothetical protein [Deinococcus]ABW34996.1 hypothetical protein Dgeo_2953 [Deinococcus geothermalis DSM 11300]TDE84986.1 hypothetical protein E0686_14180 [Deinococcus sp. S9]
MKKLILLAVLTQSIALAQVTAPAGSNPYLGANITRVYSVDDLMTRPGLLTLGKGDMFMLDFPADVTAVVTPQAATMDIPEPLGNVVVMTAKVSSGKAQVFVQLENGKYATFMVTFTPGGNGMKRIKVTDEPRTDFAQPIPAPVPPVTAMPSFTAPATGTPIFTPSTASQPAPAEPESRQQIQNVLAPVTSLPAAVQTITRAQPDWLKLSTHLGSESRGDVLTVSVTNGGARPLMFSGKDVVVTVDGRQVLVTVAGEVRVQPGETQKVDLALEGRVTPGAVMTLDWLAFDAGANAYYRVATRTF